ncbi:lipase chaperone [Burkholderia lata]|uniref:lipase secretion chaperone n=1 Tax=Burkholderia lata (strain ATCC 17760 / DSM 23089 / LMG 22485 / NCIMB 9086 / R18194 / 383) TaxID=482957 RepID=UPI00145319B0|nr:lipase secretion chaperone [Burkholderia lata]VWB42727.1 lipase chaperone [Burkholderia lata]
MTKAIGTARPRTRTAKLGIGVLLAGIAAGAVWLAQPQSGKGDAGHAAAPGIRADTRGASSFTAPASVSAPMLPGVTVPDGLRADRDGHLVKDGRVRDVFDYYLSAGNTRTQARIDAAVRGRIAAMLHAPADGEAIDLWTRYLGYLGALKDDMQTAGLADGAAPVGMSAADIERIGRVLTARAALQRQWLPDVALTWFGQADQDDRRQLQALRVVADRSLSDSERSAGLAALDADDPVARAAREAGASVQALSIAMARTRDAQASPGAASEALAR